MPRATTVEPRTPHKRRPYHRFTRSDRSKIRILCALGWRHADICLEIGCSLPAIGLILHNTTKAAADDNASDDWKYVDDDFRRKYYKESTSARIQVHEEENDSNQDQEDKCDELYDEENDLLDQTEVVPVTPKRTRKVVRRALFPIVAQHQMDSSLHTDVGTTPARGPRGQCVALADVVEPENPVKRFLASLDHDLTFIYKTLKKQRLGDKNKLFVLAKFSESELHNIFKEALPDITVAERYILVKGLKKHAQR